MIKVFDKCFRYNANNDDVFEDYNDYISKAHGWDDPELDSALLSKTFKKDNSTILKSRYMYI